MSLTKRVAVRAFAGLLCASILALPAAAQTTASASITAKAQVSGVAPLTAAGVNDLNFGVVTAGTPKAPTSLASDAGRFNDLGPAEHAGDGQLHAADRADRCGQRHDPDHVRVERRPALAPVSRARSRRSARTAASSTTTGRHGEPGDRHLGHGVAADADDHRALHGHDHADGVVLAASQQRG